MSTRVLLVEDDASLLGKMKRLLSQEGYQVRAAACGATAVEAADDFDPDLLITDWMLKNDLTGLELARALRKTRPALPVVLITGYMALEARRELAEAPVTAFMQKPFDADRFVAAVRRAAPSPKARASAVA